jgi:hypothetical protein
MLSRMAISSTSHSLFALGLSDSHLIDLLEWSSSSSRAVTLRFQSTERCSFVRESRRDVDSATKHVTTFFESTIASKTVTTITEYFWKFQLDYELLAFRGTHPSSLPENAVSMMRRSRETTVVTTTASAPRPGVVVRDPLDLNLSPFLGLLRLDGSSIEPESCMAGAGVCDLTSPTVCFRWRRTMGWT